MIDYRTPVEDILFTLRHGAEVERLPQWDDSIASEIIGQAARLIDAEIAPLDPELDATPARLVDGRVRLHPAIAAAYAKYRDAGWSGLSMPEEFGGQGQPHVFAAVISEMLSGASINFQIQIALAQGAARTIASHGTDEQKATYLPRLASGEILATMCLTEPQAGSDLSLVRTTATQADDGTWRINGGKIFITGADQDLTDDIVHLVLARTPDAPPGVKGLALFTCPAVLPDGRRNGVSVVRIEEKMGLHSSPTCQVAFDGAVAEIMGGRGEGLARMFTMMNFARLDVAMQGVGLTEVAGQRSRAYAIQRRQGRAGRGEGPDAIVRHDDVRRMLMTQMALAGGCRAMAYRALVELELGERPAWVEFMTPVCKAVATEGAMEAGNLAVQVHGGYGFLREYRVEQIVRDGRITAIYEGTNGIQSMTLASRLLRLDNGACAAAFADDAAQVAAAARADGRTAMADRLDQALADWRQAGERIAAMTNPGLVATSFMRLTGLVALGAAWSRLEAAADHSPRPDRTRAVATFVRDWMLPETRHLADRIAGGAEVTGLADTLFED